MNIPKPEDCSNYVKCKDKGDQHCPLECGSFVEKKPGEALSLCCGAPIDYSRVIQSGRHKGHGPRICSKCGKVTMFV